MSDPTSIKTPSNSALMARAYFYRLLADLLRHPRTKGIQKKLGDHRDHWKLALKSLPNADPTFSKILAPLFKKVATNDLRNWTTEYESVFGHTANAKAPLYELEYGEEHSHRQPQQLADIAAFFHAFGVTVDESQGERIDHASVELEFLFFLCLKEEYALTKEKSDEKSSLCRDAARRFLDEHAGRWLLAFFTRLSQHTPKTSILNLTAQLGLEFLLWEAKHLGISIGTSDLPLRDVQEQMDAGCVSCAIGSKAVPT